MKFYFNVLVLACLLLHAQNLDNAWNIVETDYFLNVVRW